MADSFQVESVSFCDYVTQDANGKQIMVGVYNGELRFGQIPQTWPTVHMSIVIDPKDENFRFTIQFDAPNEVSMLKINGTYSSPRKPPQENRLVLNIQMPPIPFTGAGIYTLKVIENGARLALSKKIPVNIGAVEQFLPNISLDVSISSTISTGSLNNTSPVGQLPKSP